MSAPHQPPARQDSLPHRHIRIPNAAHSTPGNPIPTLPLEYDTNASAQEKSTQASGPSSERSSGESLLQSRDDTSSESEAPSTPLTDIQDGVEVSDKVTALPSDPSPSATNTRRRRASTTYASNPDEIKRMLGDGNGTRFVETYCCGEGCCKLQPIPKMDRRGETRVTVPDNDAFRFLNLKLRPLTMETEFTKTVDLPEQKASFAPIRKESIGEKFPEEGKHDHDQNAVNVYPPKYMKPHPPYSIFNAPIYMARALTSKEAEKRTYHFDLDVTDYPEEGGVDFKVGGAVGVCPPNDPDAVEDILNQLGIPRFQRDKPVRLLTTGGRWPTIWGDEEPRELLTTRREVLTWTIDISSTPPTKPLFRLLAEHASDDNDKKILFYLCSAQGQAAFCDLRTGPHITLQQLLHAFPSSKPPLESLFGVLTQLMPRFYSLSNDPHVSADRENAGRRVIEVAVTVHQTASFDGSLRTGVGSGFLERLADRFIAAEEEARAVDPSIPEGVAGRRLNLQAPMFRGLMSNPLSQRFASDGPMVLIGAGVGMAPFRGFILNRLKSANCANKIWLIQGIRDSTLDEIYRGELGAHESEIKKVVQSRAQEPAPVTETDTAAHAAENGQPGDDDDAHPPSLAARDARSQRKVAKYVQDEVRLQADIVWFVINALDGRVFVCGSTQGMGEGVERALVDVAMGKGNLDAETAKAFWDGKKEGGQYIAETW